MQTDECKWFTLEEMKEALYESHSLLGPEPVELAMFVANIKGLYDYLCQQLDSVIIKHDNSSRDHTAGLPFYDEQL